MASDTVVPSPSLQLGTPCCGSNAGTASTPVQIWPYTTRLVPTPGASRAGTTIAMRGVLSVPSNRASGELVQLRETCPCAHSAKAQWRGGGSSGDVTSQVTLAVSPGWGDARSGAPWTSIRAPRTRAPSINEAGSKVGPQPPMNTQPATAISSRRARVKKARPMVGGEEVVEVVAVWLVLIMLVLVWLGLMSPLLTSRRGHRSWVEVAGRRSPPTG